MEGIVSVRNECVTDALSLLATTKIREDSHRKNERQSHGLSESPTDAMEGERQRVTA